jgi:hypothetical protein
MRPIVLAMLIGGLASAAAADVTPPSSPGAAPAGAPSRPTPLSIWRFDQAHGAEHLQSGLSCPAQVGGYRRTDLFNYDAFGLDVSCNYFEAGPSDITLYLTRRSGPVDAAVAEAKRELLQFGAERHPQLVSDTRSAAAGLDWSVTTYAEDGGVHSAIWIADLDGWTLEYRATYPGAAEAQVQLDIAALTDLVQRSAGVRLGVCAKSQPPARPGVAVVDQATLSSAAMMTGILGGGALAAAEDGKAVKTQQPVVWCVEQPAPTPKAPLLFWRGVHPDGSDAESDKVSAMTIDEPPELTVSPDELANLVADAKTPTTRWVASIASPDQTRVYGYFTDRPPPELLSSLFADILTGKARPLVGYGAHGKSITISMPSDK